MTLAQQFRQEGITAGRLTGERILLERLLTRKFGPLPEWVSVKFEEADLADLETWGDAILDAESLETVFFARRLSQWRELRIQD